MMRRDVNRNSPAIFASFHLFSGDLCGLVFSDNLEIWKINCPELEVYASAKHKSGQHEFSYNIVNDAYNTLHLFAHDLQRMTKWSQDRDHRHCRDQKPHKSSKRGNWAQVCKQASAIDSNKHNEVILKMCRDASQHRSLVLVMLDGWFVLAAYFIKPCN